MAEHSLVAEGASPASISWADYRSTLVLRARGLTKKKDLYSTTAKRKLIRPGTSEQNESIQSI